MCVLSAALAPGNSLDREQYVDRIDNHGLVYYSNSTSVYAIEFKSILANDVDPETGTATSATSTTLVDSTQTWTVGQWVGQNVTIVSGTGAGQIRTVTGNTVNALIPQPGLPRLIVRLITRSTASVLLPMAV